MINYSEWKLFVSLGFLYYINYIVIISKNVLPYIYFQLIKLDSL